MQLIPHQVMRIKFLAIACVLLTLSACAKNPVTGQHDIVLVSESQELEMMGEKYHPEILKIYGGQYDDPEWEAYVTKVGEKVAIGSHRKNILYHFTILDTPIINAFAIPGYIYISRGMLAYMGSEAQLAGVLGHEIGHVTARHSVRQHAQSVIGAIFAQAVAIRTGSNVSAQIVDLLGLTIIRGYGRQYELQADELGIEYMTNARYEPTEMLHVLEILKNQQAFDSQLAKEQNREPNAYHGVFATHPKNELRLQQATVTAQDTQAGQYEPIVGRETYLQKIKGMPFGSSKKEGVIRNGRFYHAELEITFELTEDWIVLNQPAALVTHNKNNTSAMVFHLEDRNTKKSPRDILESTFGKKIIAGSLVPLDIQLKAWTALINKTNTPYGYGQARVGLIFHNKKAYRFIAATKDKDEFDKYDPTFLKTMNSFRQLQTNEYQLAEPQTIQLVTVKEGDTYAELAKQTSLNHHQEEILRLINGQYPHGEPQPGTVVKIIK